MDERVDPWKRTYELAERGSIAQLAVIVASALEYVESEIADDPTVAAHGTALWPLVVALRSAGYLPLKVNPE